jgi:murein DD-endopeptidase MepM/ murein hydrolase activator NlpD
MRRLLPAALVMGLGAVPAAAQGPTPGYAAAAQQGDVEHRLQVVDAEERSVASELDESRPRLEQLRQRILARGRSYYRLVRAGLLPAGGGFDAMVDHAVRVERTRLALERDVASEGALIKRVGELEIRLGRVRSDRAPLVVQRDALQRARAALQEAEERRAAFARAFETSIRPDAVAIYGADMGPSAEPVAGFQSLRGRLPFPITGRAEAHRVNHGGGPAVELLAGTGTVVRAVAAGRVAFADRQEDYGLIVIVDHGDHYFSLYGSLGSSDVHPGDTVTSGARVGTVGSVDGSPPRLYFELRHNASTLDPAPWLGLFQPAPAYR